MRIHNLYVDAKGETHFRDIEVEFTESGRAGKTSKRLPATGIIFRQVQPDYDLDWHPAPRRQYIINLDAGVQITASDGESRKIGAGEVILVEDTSGKGHLSKALGGRLRAVLRLREVRGVRGRTREPVPEPHARRRLCPARGDARALRASPAPRARSGRGRSHRARRVLSGRARVVPDAA